MKRFRIPIFDRCCVVFDDINVARQFCEDRGVEDAPGHNSAYAFTCNASGTVVLAFDPKFINKGIVAHEAYHAARHTLDLAGVILHPDDQEMCAYLTEFIANKCFDALAKMGIE